LIELRPPRPDDIEEICALVNRAEQHDGVERVLSIEELREDLGHPAFDLAEDARVAIRDGELVGWTWVWNLPSQSRLERAFVLGVVAPEHRGAGVGRALLAWGVERARQRLRGRTHELPRYIRVNAYDWLDGNHRLFARMGFTPVRWFEELMRPLGELVAVDVPEGVMLQPWPDGRDDEIRAVRNATFADHWGSSVVEPDQWSSLVHGHGGRPDLSVIACDATTGEIVGLCLNHAYPEDEAVTGRREAWIENIGTLRERRGRGLASAMLAWSLDAFATAGFTHALLVVDADNPTGAARLYRNLGFERVRGSIEHQIEVS
jgi:mycothiol synthase